MFGLAPLAFVRPAQDDWLNEWSSTPPMSSTMHALNAAPEAVPVGPPEELLPPEGVLFEPQPATASAATPTSATARTIFLTRVPPRRDVRPARGGHSV